MSKRPPPVRIPDLADPQMPDQVRAMMDQMGAAPLDFSVDGVLGAARERVGLEDFGAEDFRSRLAVIIESMKEDEGLSAFGRLTNFNIMVRYAVNRLLLEDYSRRHPDVEARPIKAPIIIAGLPRSGTTHMLNLISADPALRHLPYWESMEPLPMPGESPAADGLDPRQRRCREALEIQDQIMPYFKNMHEMTAEHTHEEIELAGIDFSSMLFENYALVPKWRDYYLAHDQRPHYAYIKRVLQAMQGPDETRRWILKSPQHMEQLPALRETFPDATFVLPHRDPVSILISLATMMSYTARMSRDVVEPAAFSEYWGDRLERMLKACVRDYAALPAEQVVDVTFDEFMADDFGTVAKIYALAGQPFEGTAEKAIRDYADSHPRGRFGQVLYDPQELGIDIARARERYAFYMDRFGVRAER